MNEPREGYPGSGDAEWGRHRAPTRYTAEHSQTAFLTDRCLDYVATQHAARRPWFVHVSYLRPHLPFFAAEPFNTLYDPMDVPMPVRAPTP